MNCLKCGAETQDRQCFCPTCQEGMRAYPVRPDTPVYLPVHRGSQSARKPAPRQPKAEEVAARLRKKVLALRLAVIGLVLALGVSLFVIYSLSREEESGHAIGQNYSASPAAYTTSASGN